MPRKSVMWSFAAAGLVLVAGALFVPLATGSLVELKSFFNVLPVAILVGMVTRVVLGAVFGDPPTAVEKLASSGIGLVTTVVIVVLFLVVLLLVLLR